MKTNIYLIFPVLLLFACSEGNNPSETATEPRSVEPAIPVKIAQVSAVFETEPVDAALEDDAADDPAFWMNAKAPENSLIFGSDKKKGLDVFNMEGKRIKTYEVGRINNVDVRKGIQGKMDVIAGSNRSTNATDVWRIENANGSLTYLGSVPSEMPDVYGFCLYHEHTEGRLYAFINSKTGMVEQWELTLTEDAVNGTLVRLLNLERQVEGMVVDDLTNELYVGVEEAGVYRFDAQANGATEGSLIPMTSQENDQIRYDVEGLAIMRTKEERGILIVSSQGNNSYALFDRSQNHQYLGSFKVVDGAVDGAQETDGIEAVSGSFGDAFPEGIFICQDGYNYDDELKRPQNFKVVSWKEIQDMMEL